jgi:hypothetical protein
MQNFKELQVILSPLRMNRNKLKSKRLLQLLNYTNEKFLHSGEYVSGLIPDLSDAIKELDYLVEWRTI